MKKNTIKDRGLAIDKPMILPDGTENNITLAKEQKRRIINFDETEHSFTTKNEKGGSRYMIWGDTNYTNRT